MANLKYGTHYIRARHRCSSLSTVYGATRVFYARPLLYFMNTSTGSNYLYFLSPGNYNVTIVRMDGSSYNLGTWYISSYARTYSENNGSYITNHMYADGSHKAAFSNGIHDSWLDNYLRFS